MYSALPQRYNYNKGLSVSFVVNIVIFALILQTHGSIFANHSQEKTKTRTISMKNYKMVHKTAPHSSSDDDKKMDKVEKVQPQKPQPKPREIPTDKPSKLAKKLEQLLESKPLPISEIIQEKSSTVQQTISQEITHEKLSEETSEQNDASQPASDASYFGLNNEPPLYPMISFQMGESGNVTIEYIVSKEGVVIFAQVVESSGHIRLDRVALTEFKRWKFTPAKNLMGAPVDSHKKIITFSFDLQNHGITIK